MLVMTMMVRDEADIVAATLEFHLAQGVDRIIVTDNASVDGTREILADYAAVAPVTVLDDPEHRKQQGAVVTAMARMAHTEFGADWVINADADEFIRPVDPALTLASVFEALDQSIGSFTVPVVNLVGPVARNGAGFSRLHWRDERSESELASAGVLAHPTPNAVHVGSADVTVAQGNHFVSIESHGAVPTELALEVLHLPWRSWSQFERKTVNMGRGYEASPDLRPSPNHHGMRDYRRWKMGTLEAFYVLRNGVSESDFEIPGFVRDESLADALASLLGTAQCKEHLAASLERDELYDPTLVADLRAVAERQRAFDDAAHADFVTARADADSMRQRAWNFEQEIYELQREKQEQHVQFEEAVQSRDARIVALESERSALRSQLDKYEAQPVLKALRKGAAAAKRITRRG